MMVNHAWNDTCLTYPCNQTATCENSIISIYVHTYIPYHTTPYHTTPLPYIHICIYIYMILNSIFAFIYTNSGSPHVAYANMHASGQKSMSTEEAQHFKRSCKESIDFLRVQRVVGAICRLIPEHSRTPLGRASTWSPCAVPLPASPVAKAGGKSG